MNVVVFFVLIFTVLGSGSLIFLFKPDDQRVLKFLLAFSGAFLIGITFLKLVPEVFSKPAMFTGVFVLLGFLLQLMLSSSQKVLSMGTGMHILTVRKPRPSCY